MMPVDSQKYLMDLMWDMTATILSNLIKDDQDKWIRRAFPKEGAPDWAIDDNVVFLNLSQRDDEYSRQRDSVNKSMNGTVVKQTTRTRVWDLSVKCYGPDSFDICTAMQDGAFRVDVERMLSRANVYLVPYLDRVIQANEIWGGRWWERWDTTLTFNEAYVVTEDVGHIEEVTIKTYYNRR